MLQTFSFRLDSPRHTKHCPPLILPGVWPRGRRHAAGKTRARPLILAPQPGGERRMSDGTLHFSVKFLTELAAQGVYNPRNSESAVLTVVERGLFQCSRQKENRQ
jgi:hypothetical protein